MKKLFIGLFMIAFTMISIPVIGQNSSPCMPGTTSIAKVSNVVCNGTNLSFDLTVSKAGVPLSLSGSGFKLYLNSTPFTQLFNDGSSTATLTDFSVTTNGGTGCPDISNIYFEPGNGETTCNPVLQNAVSIPTLSQWGLIALGLLMSIFGIVAVKQEGLAF